MPADEQFPIKALSSLPAAPALLLASPLTTPTKSSGAAGGATTAMASPAAKSFEEERTKLYQQLDEKVLVDVVGGCGLLIVRTMRYTNRHRKWKHYHYHSKK